MENLIQGIKKLIIEVLDIEDLTVEDFKDDQIIFGEGLGLDSIDALELGVALAKKYNITIQNDSQEMHQHFTTPATIAEFIRSCQSNQDLS